MIAKNSLRGLLCPDWLTHYLLNIRATVLALLLTGLSTSAQTTYELTGTVLSASDKKPLPGAVIKIEIQNAAVQANNLGKFTISSTSISGVLTVSFIGFKSTRAPFNALESTSFQVALVEDSTVLQEINVSTGYQTLPKERSTGSFVQIDNELLNRRISTNILDRLDGVASGVLFNNRYSNLETFNVRGRSTLLRNTQSKGVADPLIVLDNFPYEGDIENINPNDVESITILKDAAAASIWGARSGNGVIVITTKKGKLNAAPQVEFNSNFTIGGHPDLSYNRGFLSSSEYIGVEKYLFNKGYFNSDILTGHTLISPVVEILSDTEYSETEKDQQLASLATKNVQDSYTEYLYQRSFNQQYSLSLRGSSANMRYNLSAGYDKNRNTEVRNGTSRISLNAFNTYSPLKNLDITTGILYTDRTVKNNNTINDSPGGKYGSIPYSEWTDENGNPTETIRGYRNSYKRSMEEKGLQDWAFRPLDDLNLADNETMVRDLLIRAGIKYKIKNLLDAEVLYQNQRQGTTLRNLQLQETYAVRDYINRFAQINTSTKAITYNFPVGDILTYTENEQKAQTIRGQLTFNHTVNQKHQIASLAGLEVRETKGSGFDRIYYGYDDENGTSVTNLNFQTIFPTNPTSSSSLPSQGGTVTGTINRYYSYFGNGSYTYDHRYIFTLSGRKDGANIFGVKTRDKVTPFWSAGIGWVLSNERFYNSEWLPYMKIRGTYGYNGNVYNGSAFLTTRYVSTNEFGLPYSIITAPPNAELRWEKVKNLNIGIDLSSKSKRVDATLEFYTKEGQDLIEEIPLTPSSGFTTFTGNGASTRTRGIDLSISTRNLTGAFGWGTTLLFSQMKDRVLSFSNEYNNSTLTASNMIPVEGNSLFGVYSYKWGGVDAASGDPQGYLNGELSKDWTNIISTTPVDELVYSGSSRPKQYGSLLNNFSYKDFSLSLNIVYKFNYYFRRNSTSLNYSQVLSTPHRDYLSRWQQPGDEVISDVPSLVYPNNSNRSDFYTYSEALIEKGDHIRLQDFRLSYSVPTRALAHAGMRNLLCYAYLNNVSILWKANRAGLDPDNYTGRFTPPRTLAFGIRGTF